MILKNKGKTKRIMVIILSVVAILAIVIFAFVNQKSFGKLPDGERKERIKGSLNYKDGKFRNQSDTPQLTGDDGFLKMMYKFLFVSHERVTPC